MLDSEGQVQGQRLCPRDCLHRVSRCAPEMLLRSSRCSETDVPGIGGRGGGVSEEERVDLKGTVTLEHSEKGALLSRGSHFLLVLAWTFPLGHDFFKHEPSPLWKNRTIWKGKLPLRTAILGLKM